MKTHFNPKNNPRVIIIQKLYGKFYNEDNDIEFPKHRFKKFIKDIVFGTIERNDLILDELKVIWWIDGLFDEQTLILDECSEDILDCYSATIPSQAEDGVIEAFKVRESIGFAYAVQWHPEWQVMENPLSLALFRAFGEACRKYALAK